MGDHRATRHAVEVLANDSTFGLRVTRHVVEVLAFDTSSGPDAAPTGLTAAVTGTTVDLVWTDNATDETGYIVQRRTGSEAWVTLDDTLPSDTEAFSDPGLANGTYTYRVAAVKNGVRSAWVEATVVIGGSNRIGGTGAIRRSPRVVR